MGQNQVQEAQSVGGGPPSQHKVGTITTVSATQLSVLVAGTEVPAAYLRSYANPGPVVGDLVALVRQDATWLVLGPFSGVGPNTVLNNSFEQDGAGSAVPTAWFLFNEVGVATISTVEPATEPPSGQFVAQVDPAASARTTVLYSSPIPVLPGQVWALSAFTAATGAGAGVGTGDVTLNALGFTLPTTLMPGQVFNTVVATVNNIALPPPWTSISGTITIPAGTTRYLRVGLRSILASGVGEYWDFVIARRIS